MFYKGQRLTELPAEINGEAYWKHKSETGLLAELNLLLEGNYAGLDRLFNWQKVRVNYGIRCSRYGNKLDEFIVECLPQILKAPNEIEWE